MGQDWAKLGQNWAKDLNAIGVPIVIVETCPFGSRHRFDCSQGISKVTLISYQHPDGLFGAVIKEMFFHGER